MTLRSFVPRVWPVIHVRDTAQTLACAATAAKAGVHGVFLIHMDGRDEMLDPLLGQICIAHPALQVGVNYLSLDPLAALERSLAQGYDATWSDRPGVRSEGVSEEARQVAARLAEAPAHRFFASVAFKYQPIDDRPGLAAQRAWALGMTPTTSGLATGAAPQVGKLTDIREALGPDAPFAVASGITPANVGLLAPALTDILVATGVSHDFHFLDADLLAELIANLG